MKGHGTKNPAGARSDEAAMIQAGLENQRQVEESNDPGART
jgi:hypothetical protein